MPKAKPKRGTPPGGGLPPSEAGPRSGVHRVAAAAADSAPEGPPTRPAPASAKARFAERLARTSPTACLERAMNAKTPALRVRHARAGLAGPCDLDTQAMLLRQAYLGELERGAFEAARVAAEQVVALGVLPDVARHDAARACQALGDVEAAIAHLREAARVSPPDRRTFHLSTLGGMLLAHGRPADAVPMLVAALATPDAAAPLLRGQLAVARFVASGDVSDLELAYHGLLHDRAGEGYGRYVLGELAMARGDRRAAEVFLSAFLSKATRARPASQAALRPEIERARAVLGRMVWN
jgi:tetratricopeptide (TPR) repeat protein